MNEINSIELQEGDRIRHVDAEGLLISNLGDEKETYRLVPLLAEEESPAVQFDLTLDADIGSGFDYLGQVEDLYVFGLNKLDQWEIFTVSKEGEILETVVVNPASPDAYFVQFVNIEEDRIYVLQEFREAYFMTVLDSSLNEIAEIPIERVEEVTFGIAVGSDSFGKLVILDDYSRFAFVDMQTNQISRFRSLSEDEFWFYFIGLGFSQQAFLIEDGDELISYDLDLGLNWSFDVLDNEMVIRAGPNMFLHREDDGELFILQSD